MVLLSKFSYNTELRDTPAETTDKVCRLTTPQGDITLKLIASLRGGKSGDSVFIVQNGRKKAVLKVFAKDTKHPVANNEIKLHSKFMGLFPESFIPCPIIYLYGTIKGAFPFKGIPIKESLEFIIMEALTPMYELDQFIRELCNNKLTRRVDMINIVCQLFYIVSKMNIAGIKHCDLHTKNIMVIPTKGKKTLDFSYLEAAATTGVPIGRYTVKILDFGEGSTGACRKCRTLSGALVDLRKSCITNGGIRTTLMDRLMLLKGQLPKYSCISDVDLNFLCVILEIMQMADKRISVIDTTKFWKAAQGQMGKDKVAMFAELFKEIQKLGAGGWRRII
jgi:hypothetical protein